MNKRRDSKGWANKNPGIGSRGRCGFCLRTTYGIIIIDKREVCGDCAYERLWPNIKEEVKR